MTRAKLLILILSVAGLQSSCGGTEADLGPIEDVESGPPDMLATPSWPDAPDLGVVVSSEVVPTDDVPPPPEFVR